MKKIFYFLKAIYWDIPKQDANIHRALMEEYGYWGGTWYFLLYQSDKIVEKTIVWRV